MAKFRFQNDREAMIPDLQGAILEPNQIFDPADFGVPDWLPEPDPHPLFVRIDSSRPAPKAPQE